MASMPPPPRPEPKAEPVIGFLLPKPMAALAQVATEAALHLMSTNIRGSIILQVDTVLPGFVGPVVAFALAHWLCSCLLAMSAHTSAMGDIDHAAIESRPNLVHAESQGTGDQFASNVRANARWAEQCFGAAGAHIAGPLLRPCQPWHLPPLSLAGLGTHKSRPPLVTGLNLMSRQRAGSPLPRAIRTGEHRGPSHGWGLGADTRIDPTSGQASLACSVAS